MSLAEKIQSGSPKKILALDGGGIRGHFNRRDFGAD